MPNLVSVLIACHNRRAFTLRVLADLTAQVVDTVEIRIFLYDDGSDDGTAAAVRARYPKVRVLQGDGTSFWATSMSILEKCALEAAADSGHFLLWLNDDVVLARDSLGRALAVERRHPGAIVIGATRDQQTGDTTYSGFIRYGRHPLHLAKVNPVDVEQQVDCMNGNFVLIPAATARKVSGIDGEFSHSWADIDYGLRAKRLGIEMVLMPGYIGDCSLNSVPLHGNVYQAWKAFIGPKGAGEPRSLARMYARHGGVGWPRFFVATYMLWFYRQCKAATRRSRRVLE